MTWFASSANETQSQNEHAHFIVAVDMDFSSGHLRLWSGTFPITILGNTFIGAGHLGKISMPPERVGLDATTKTFTLSGVDVSVLSEADIEASFGRSVTEYYGFLNPNTLQFVDTPEINWEGRIDTIKRVDGPEPTIQVNAEHRLVLLDVPDGWRFTHQHQQQFYSGDNGFDQLKAIAMKEIIWGSQRVIIGGPGREPGGPMGVP